MLFYKSERIFAKKPLKYTGFSVVAGDQGKIISIRPDLISILWDKDKRQLARLCPPNNILKATEQSFDEFKKRSNFDRIINSELNLIASLELKAKNIIEIWQNKNYPLEDRKNKIGAKIIEWRQNRDDLDTYQNWNNFVNLLKQGMGVESEEFISQLGEELGFSSTLSSSKFFSKEAQNPKSLARQFMSEEDYDNFKKLLDLRKLYSEENVGRSEEGLKGTRTDLKDINEKIDMILDKYKNDIMSDFNLKASSQEVQKFVRRAKKQPWSKPNKKEKLDAKSIDSSISDDVEVDNVKPDESNVLDYGQDPLAQDNFSGYSS